MPTMKALKEHKWGSGKVRKGQIYEASEQESELLQHLQWATPQQASLSNSELSPRTGQPKRQYNRRDMQAED